MVSGALDAHSFKGYEELQKEPLGTKMSKTECAHIFSESTNVGIEDNSILQVLRRFAPSLEGICDELLDNHLPIRI